MTVRKLPLVSAITLLFTLACGISVVAKELKTMHECDPAEFWSMDACRETPFDVETIASRTEDGYRVDEMYFTSEVTPDGPNRVFCAFARPVNAAEPVGLFVDIHGGGGHCDPDRAMWFARSAKCAVINLDWSGKYIPGAEKYTIWQGPYADPYANHFRVTPSVKDCSIYHIVIAVRRAIDFAATQPGIDMSRVACGGGSWGGFLSSLVAGIDPRVKCIYPALGAGAYTRDTFGKTGGNVNNLPADERKNWLKAYDPASYSSKVTARTFQYACSNDYFFWLGDVLKYWHALNVDKRLLIRPNSNHEAGGPQLPSAIVQWVEFYLNNTKPLPNVVPGSLCAKGDIYTWKTTGPAEIVKSTLYWSPGNPCWPARYWMPIEATWNGDSWQAEIPAELSNLSARVFVTIFDADNVAVSSELVARKGLDPSVEAGPLWNGGAAWDIKGGTDAWRVTGCAENAGPGGLSLKAIDNGAIEIGPADKETKFAAITNSIILASGHAPDCRGLSLVIDGNGEYGVLTVTLQKKSGAINEIAYSAKVKYGKDSTTIDLPWCVFKNPNGATESPYPFDGLRLEGERADGSPIILRELSLLKS